MTQRIYRRIIALILEAARLARSIGITNLLQPGLVREMIIADILGHELIHSKRHADAHAVGNPDEKYEYLSCKEEPSAGEREGATPRMEKPSAGEREGATPRMEKVERDNLTACSKSPSTSAPTL